MSSRKILTIGEPVLHKRADEVDPSEIRTDGFASLIEDMIDTMRAANGVGLAAPQIGVSKRVFVAETSEGPIALINPMLTKLSKKTIKYEEGCLSIPGKTGVVKRFQEVQVRGLTLEGNEIQFVARGFFARVMQHEIDHLDGILYVDRMESKA